MEFYNTDNGWGVHKVKITFQFEKFKGHIVKSVGGNINGLDALKHCAEFEMDDQREVYGYLENTCKLKFNEGLDCDYFTLELMSENGDTCEFEVECQELQEMIVAVEILSFEP